MSSASSLWIGSSQRHSFVMFQNSFAEQITVMLSRVLVWNQHPIFFHRCWPINTATLSGWMRGSALSRGEIRRLWKKLPGGLKWPSVSVNVFQPFVKTFYSETLFVWKSILYFYFQEPVLRGRWIVTLKNRRNGVKFQEKSIFELTVLWPLQHFPGPRDPTSHGRAGCAAGQSGRLLLSRYGGVPGGLQEEFLLLGDEHTTTGQ